MKTVSSGKKTTIIFDSLADYRRTMEAETGVEYSYSNISERMDKWHGTETWGEFMELLSYGDDKITDKIKVATGKAVKEYQNKYEKVLTNYKFDVVGEFFDIGLVMQGVPETWLNPEFEEAEKPKADITINGSFPDGTDLDNIIANASKILGMAKILEDNDVMVSIKVVTGGEKFMTGDKTLYMETMVKAYDEPINFSKCSSLLSPTYLRRGWFKMAEKTAGNKIRSNYGKIINVDGALELRNDNSIRDFERKVFK